MKDQLLFALALITLLFSCINPKTEQTQPIDKTLKLDYLYQLSNDTIRYSFDGKIGLNKDLDSLLDEQIEMFILKDTLHNAILIHYHVHEGPTFVNRINDNKYEILGKSRYPVNGNWKIPFQQHLMFRYILEIDKNSYQLYRDKSLQPKLPYDKNRIKTLQKSILNDTICTNKDWEIAFQCFPRIHEYEYQLFAALLDNQIQYAETYVNLRDSVDVVGSGQLNQYYMGNIMTLIDLGILSEKYDIRQYFIKRLN